MEKLLAGTVLSTVIAMMSSAAIAHEEFRVIGTLVTHTETMIEVAARDGATRTIKVDRQTVVTQDAQSREVSALEDGMTLVVDAYGDTMDDLLALEIRIVPPIED